MCKGSWALIQARNVLEYLCLNARARLLATRALSGPLLFTEICCLLAPQTKPSKYGKHGRAQASNASEHSASTRASFTRWSPSTTNSTAGHQIGQSMSGTSARANWSTQCTGTTTQCARLLLQTACCSAASKPHIIASLSLFFLNGAKKPRFEMCFAPKHRQLLGAKHVSNPS